MTVAELTRRMPEQELAEWMAFYGLEPWGEDRADLRAGIVASTIANASRAKHSKAYRPIDFIPRFGPATNEKRRPDTSDTGDTSELVTAVMALFM